MNDTQNYEVEKKKQTVKTGWSMIFRIILKAAVILVLFNVLLAWLYPLDFVSQLSLYNKLVPGRLRLPYGENAAESYNLSLNNIPAMLSSHILSQPKMEDEFRVIIIGDSGTWGWLQENEDTLSSQITARNLKTENDRRVVVYNLGYPIMALTKDLLILEEAMQYEPDLILWPVTLQSFPRAKQLVPPLVQENPDRVRALINDFELSLDPQDESLQNLSFLDRTLIGQRRALADLLRLQSYGFSWAATRLDQSIPENIAFRATDFDEDVSWEELVEPVVLDDEILAFDALDVGERLSDDVPLIVINEPIYISDGRNSDLRYNAWYPRWAYDSYRTLLTDRAIESEWRFLDIWDIVPPEEFTDSPVHLTRTGTELVANILSDVILMFAQQP